MSTPFTPAGSNVPARIVFNSGTLDFGSNRIVEIDNVAVSIDWTTAPLYILNSIKPADLTRHTQKVTMTGKLKSWPAEMFTIALGSSTTGTPNEIDTLDGQPTLQSPVLTFFDRNAKQYQYQFIGALFKSTKSTLKAEDYAEFDFELEAKDIIELYTS